MEYKRKILLILGVSGVGKSSVIREIQNKRTDFIRVAHYTTRPLRFGETEKIHVSEKEMDIFENSSDYCVIRTHYADKVFRYAICYSEILHIISSGKNYAVMDWAVSRMSFIEQSLVENDIFSVYLIPPSENELQRRLSLDERNNTGERLEKAKKEIFLFKKGSFTGKYSMSIICDSIHVVANEILKNFY